MADPTQATFTNVPLTPSTDPQSRQQQKQQQHEDRPPFQQFNGVHSSHSSRSSSPSIRSGNIPPSQLPPARNVPQAQLPPSRSPLTITQQVAGLSLSQSTAGTQRFATSTPTFPGQQSSPFSPVVGTGQPSPQTNSGSNQQSAQSYFGQVQGTNQIPSSSSVQRKPSETIQQSYSENRPVFSNDRNLDQRFPQNQASAATFSQNQPVYSQNSVIPPSSTYSQNQQNSVTVQSQNQPTFTDKKQSAYGQSSTLPPTSTSGQAPSASTVNTSIYQQNSVSQYGQVSARPPNPNLPTAPNSSQVPPNPSLGQTPPASTVSQNRYIYGQNSTQPPPSGTNGLPSRPTANVTNNFNYGPGKPASNYNNSNNYYNNTNNTRNSNAGAASPQTSAPTTNGPPKGPMSAQRVNLHTNRYPTPTNVNPPPGNVQQQYPYPGKYQQNEYQQQNAYPAQQQSYQQQPPQGGQPSQSYQQQPYQQQQQAYRGVTQTGFNKMWGMENFDLLQTPNILPPKKLDLPKVVLGQEAMEEANCSPEIFRCTMTKIPENSNLLQKSRLPLGVLIHPFKDLSHLPVIQCSVIVRCRACRTYINPFVFFVDSKRWKCNLCYRVNELPEEFQYDPLTKTYGDPSRRPEIKSSTLEYIAPAEYMLRPPQPAVYLFLLDVSRLAVESGYLKVMCEILKDEIHNIPGDARTQIGFVTYDSTLHFYALPEDASRPHEMTVLDVDEVFLPTPDNLLVNLKDRTEMIMELLDQLPNRYANTYDTNSALGAALQSAFKLMGATGGRVTVFQASLPNVGPGALTAREDPATRSNSQVDTQLLNPATDFYKRLALECSGQQIAVDLFVVNSTYVDVATISGISRFSGGCIHHFPLLRPNNVATTESFSRCFKRYLTRKIGFEAVMRIRCTRGLAIHTFHGNFFVRSTDLLSLPNINPDAGFGMQVSIEENLTDVQTVCFQAALLYTSSKGERRIRVHTLCLPVASTLQDVIHSADQECVVGLLAKMAVDRSMQSSISDAKEAFINVAIDILSSYKMSLNMGAPTSGLLAPNCLKLLPLYISAILKHTAFRTGATTRIDDRVTAMIDMKTTPLYLLMQQIYPDLYPVHDLEHQQMIMNSEEEPVPAPPKLQLSARFLDSKGVFLLDSGSSMTMLVCPGVSSEFLQDVFGVGHYNSLPDDSFDIPIQDNLRNQRLHQFIYHLNEEKPYAAPVHVLKDSSPNRMMFYQRLVEDRMENALSYHEFLQHLRAQVK